jgi:ligand-binding SRPBCC domain-containing protein
MTHTAPIAPSTSAEPGTKPGLPAPAPLTIAREGRNWRLNATIDLAAPLETVFDFFSHARNLERLTPPFLNFHVLTPEPIDMHAGTLIDYKIIIRGIPVRWRTEITRFDPPTIFTDRQLRGPYTLWDHTHTFEALSPTVTRACDIVLYRPKGWVMAPIINRLVVQNDVRKIFAFRRAQMAELFGLAGADTTPHAATQS